MPGNRRSRVILLDEPDIGLAQGIVSVHEFIHLGFLAGDIGVEARQLAFEADDLLYQRWIVRDGEPPPHVGSTGSDGNSPRRAKLR